MRRPARGGPEEKGGGEAAPSNHTRRGFGRLRLLVALEPADDPLEAIYAVQRPAVAAHAVRLLRVADEFGLHAEFIEGVVNLLRLIHRAAMVLLLVLDE